MNNHSIRSVVTPQKQITAEYKKRLARSWLALSHRAGDVFHQANIHRLGSGVGLLGNQVVAQRQRYPERECDLCVSAAGQFLPAAPFWSSGCPAAADAATQLFGGFAQPFCAAAAEARYGVRASGAIERTILIVEGLPCWLMGPRGTGLEGCRLPVSGFDQVGQGQILENMKLKEFILW